MSGLSKPNASPGNLQAGFIPDSAAINPEPNVVAPTVEIKPLEKKISFWSKLFGKKE